MSSNILPKPDRETIIVAAVEQAFACENDNAAEWAAS
jgi:hypothetical protein